MGIFQALPEDLRKPAVNQWLGSLMCPPWKLIVFPVQDPHVPVPFAGPRFTREAPGGWDVFCRQLLTDLSILGGT